MIHTAAFSQQAPNRWRSMTSQGDDVAHDVITSNVNDQNGSFQYIKMRRI